MTLRVAPMSWTLAGSVSILHRACFPEDPWDVDAIQQIMKIPGFFGRVGWVGTDPVGFALVLALAEEAEVLSLGVAPDHRRAGMGSALLASICLEAGRRGVERIVLEVAVDNQAARAMYGARGFSVVGRRRNYYHQAGCSVDALILRAWLVTRFPAT